MTTHSLLNRLRPSREAAARRTGPHYHRGPDGRATACWDEACDHPHLSVVTQRPAWARRDAA